METCFSVAVIVNQDLSLFPFHHEALYPYGLNHSSHWRWHRANIIATHKTLAAPCHFPPLPAAVNASWSLTFTRKSRLVLAPLPSTLITECQVGEEEGYFHLHSPCAYGKGKHHSMSLPPLVCRYKSRQEVVSVWPLASSSIPFLCLHIRHLTEPPPPPRFFFSVQPTFPFFLIHLLHS